MSFNRYLNDFPPGDSCVVTTDGVGAIALASQTSGVVSVAFTTDGTNGSLTVTISSRGTGYSVTANAATATAVRAAAQVGTPTATTFAVIVSDLATPTVVNLATAAVRVNIQIAYAV